LNNSSSITIIFELHSDHFDRGIETSLMSPVIWIQALLPGLRDSKGKILYTSSSAVKTPLPAWSPFVSIRAAMQQVLASLAKEEPAITSLAIEPGVMRTEAFDRALKAVKTNMPAGYVKWFEQIQQGPNFLDPALPAESFVKLVLNAPSSKSGTFCSWNELWVKELQE